MQEPEQKGRRRISADTASLAGWGSLLVDFPGRVLEVETGIRRRSKFNGVSSGEVDKRLQRAILGMVERKDGGFGLGEV